MGRGKGEMYSRHSGKCGGLEIACWILSRLDEGRGLISFLCCVEFCLRGAGELRKEEGGWR